MALNVKGYIIKRGVRKEDKVRKVK